VLSKALNSIYDTLANITFAIFKLKKIKPIKKNTMKKLNTFILSSIIILLSHDTIAQCVTDQFYLGTDTRMSPIGSDTLAPDGQSFKAGQSGVLSFVALDISATNDTCTLSTMDVRIDIIDGDTIAGTKLASEVFTIPVDFARTLDTFNFTNPAIVTATQMYTIAFTLVPGQNCGNGEPDLIWYFEFPTSFWTNTGGIQYQNGVITSLGNTQYFTTCVDTSCIINTSVTDNSPILTASATGVNYQWLDCNNNYAIISGETNQSFTTTTNGSYAVEISGLNCIDTSACIVVTNISIIENSFENSLVVSPNPTLGNFAIDLGKNYSTTTVSITDLNGKQVHNKTYNQTQLINLELNEPTGVYFLTVQTNEKKAVIKVIKQ